MQGARPRADLSIASPEGLEIATRPSTEDLDATGSPRGMSLRPRSVRHLPFVHSFPPGPHTAIHRVVPLTAHRDRYVGSSSVPSAVRHTDIDGGRSDPEWAVRSLGGPPCTCDVAPQTLHGGCSHRRARGGAAVVGSTERRGRMRWSNVCATDISWVVSNPDGDFLCVLRWRTRAPR
jgi:hypothetical protein